MTTQQQDEYRAYRLGRMDAAKGYPYGRSAEEAWGRLLLAVDRLRLAYWFGWSEAREVQR
jgi:hypothetical protein